MIGQETHEVERKIAAILERLKAPGLCNLFVVGKATEPICEIPVSSNKIGLILFSGLNPAASAAEENITVINKAMSGVMDIGQLRSFKSL